MLAIAFALIVLALVVFLAFVTGALDAATIRAMITSLRQFGTRVTSFIGTRVTARFGGNNGNHHGGDDEKKGGNGGGNSGNCHCLACHHFRHTTLPTEARHRLLSGKVGKVVDELMNDVQEFLAEQQQGERA